ncbi:hypothetical protein [Mesorhizobium xinjiangense]|uniref:hypothetical protein n=1 Tax=Mesorhizobium xinjiangense TaxID=2678685 RepID=UPI0012EEC64F|nr:hypothetical protein [Mesorhizobium xinjiangense]
MARRRSSFGFMGRFGRSGDLRQLDAALHALDLHPALVPEGVKLTIVNRMKEHGEEEPPPHAYPFTAAMVAYCALGRDVFEAANGAGPGLAVEARIEAALTAGEGFDAEMILLAMHAGLIEPGVVERFGLTAESDD